MRAVWRTGGSKTHRGAGGVTRAREAIGAVGRVGAADCVQLGRDAPADATALVSAGGLSAWRCPRASMWVGAASRCASPTKMGTCSGWKAERQAQQKARQERTGARPDTGPWCHRAERSRRPQARPGPRRGAWLFKRLLGRGATDYMPVRNDGTDCDWRSIGRDH